MGIGDTSHHLLVDGVCVYYYLILTSTNSRVGAVRIANKLGDVNVPRYDGDSEAMLQSSAKSMRHY